jgi:transcriptional regulator GlxA family with amidase domain
MTVTSCAESLVAGILIFDDVEELDFVGPWEVFGSARECGAALTTISVAEMGGAVRGAHGLRAIANHSFLDAPRLDILLIPGGFGTRRIVSHRRTLEWIRAAAADCRWVASVCTGARVLATTGLVAGRRMTTHSMFLDEMAQCPHIEVVRSERYVVDGKYVSSAGISAGIDMSLWLVGQIFGKDLARETRAYMEYDPASPYAVAKRNEH